MIIQRKSAQAATKATRRSEVGGTGRGKLLFIAYGDENVEEGVSYAIELAKALHEDIVMLRVRKKDSFAKKIEDVMASVAFAEAGEHETAREMTELKRHNASSDYSSRVAKLALRANMAGVHLTAESTDRELIPAIRSYVKRHTRVDKVVLSPSVTERELLKTRDLTLLVRTASRPIVTMTRQSIHDPLSAKHSIGEKEYAGI